MGQYYYAYLNRGGKKKVFDNSVDGDWQGLKLMEHSWWLNPMVANVVNDLYYNKAKLGWVGDYYEEDNYNQINCDAHTVKAIGDFVWNTQNKIKCTLKKVRYLTYCLIVNHTKKQILVCDDYYKNNKFIEKWDNEEWENCIHPLPLLTCTASHSGGSYYGINKDQCGIWFNDEIEIVLYEELNKLLKDGYTTVMFEFKEERYN